MCGFSGFLSPHPQPAFPIVQMNDLVRHRGPDDEGFVLFSFPRACPLICYGRDTYDQTKNLGLAYAPTQAIERVSNLPVTLALGHRRLAIVDLSSLGHQPMCTPNGRYWIVYNGEVYNHSELRMELEILGHRFFSHSDTEVVLAAYAQWGVECLHRFNGMWSFVLYDVEQEEVFFARDRFGVKPLYYWIAPDGTLCFGSEIKQLTAFPGWKAHINPRRTYDYLVWGVMDHTDETLFEGVYQVRPGNFIHLNVHAFHGDTTGRLPAEKWYDLVPADFSGSFADAADEFKHRLTDSVRIRLRADVSVGSCLSGGLDSSSIVCMMNQLLHEQDETTSQKTFSAYSDIQRFDERKWIDQVVEATGVQAHYVSPTVEELFYELPMIAWHQDEPFGSTSIFAQWMVFRLAEASGVKVILDGQGADEQLAGYHGFFALRFMGLLKAGHLRQLWKEIQQTKQLHGYADLRVLMEMADVLLPQVVKQPLRRFAGRSHAAPSWLNKEIREAEGEGTLGDVGTSYNTIQQMSVSQLTAMNLPMLLHWEDRSSMAHSIEARVPFLDYRLVEFLLGLPEEYKLSSGVTKKVLRTGMNGIIPDGIRDRMDKLGFVTPEEVWVKENASGLFREKLRQAVDASQGVLGDESLTVFEDIISGNSPFSFLPWRWINFGEWMQTFAVSKT